MIHWLSSVALVLSLGSRSCSTDLEKMITSSSYTSVTSTLTADCIKPNPPWNELGALFQTEGTVESLDAVGRYEIPLLLVLVVGINLSVPIGPV